MYMAPEQIVEWAMAAWTWLESPAVGGAASLVAAAAMWVALYTPARDWIVDRWEEIDLLGWRVWIDWRISEPLDAWLAECLRPFIVWADSAISDSERRHNELRDLIWRGLRTMRREKRRRVRGEESERL